MDTSFGTSGVTVIAPGFSYDLALLPSGKIVVDGITFGQYQVATVPFAGRLLANGLPDVSFDYNGYSVLSRNMESQAVLLGDWL